MVVLALLSLSVAAVGAPTAGSVAPNDIIYRPLSRELPPLRLRTISFNEPVGSHSIDLATAGREHGAFLITDHGIPATTVLDAQNALENFYALPEEDKGMLSHPVDADPIESLLTGYSQVGRENVDALNRPGEGTPDPVEKFSLTFAPGFNLSAAPNRYHPRVPNMKVRMEALLLATTRIGRRVFREIAVAMGLNETYFDNSFTDGTLSAMRCLHYPGIKSSTSPLSSQFRMAPHRDVGPFTLLLSDPSESLEYLYQGSWRRVAYQKHAILVHLGDAIKFLTSTNTTTQWRSNWHRVGIPDVDTTTGLSSSRYSIAQFFNFDADMPLQPLKFPADGKLENQNRAIPYGEWIAQQFKNNGFVSSECSENSQQKTNNLN